MTRIYGQCCKWTGLACYSPFPLALFLIEKELIDRIGVWIVYVVGLGSGIGVATSFLLPWAMLPDTIDHSEMLTGLRHEGLFCALFVFFGKLAAGLGLAGSSLMLEFAGFDPEFGATQVSNPHLILTSSAPSPTPHLIVTQSCRSRRRSR